MGMEDNSKADTQPVFEWILCPNCKGKFFKRYGAKTFDIEIACAHCKGVYRIHSTADGVAYDQKKEPRYSYNPNEFKERKDKSP